ncbi:hypothetical protein Pla175_40630 [Pirellulimonas nuda]|uniref:Uncharacterized protein n=1 Tax=Pirellulimonas nuda TaxID=2528009 RepID=A0A518DGQ2_9BACT|nr:hypothetical protein [Pirellulimonas nuda]QDU90654.1 hypothetical protein Pla175_40630 [Pirellulimonas nuda]
MHRWFLFVIATLVAAAAPASAGDGHACGDRVCCCLKGERVTEDVPCWEVGCERVCIPPVRPPWAPGGSGLTLLNFLKHDQCCRCTGACTGHCTGGCGCSSGCWRPGCCKTRCVATLSADSQERTHCEWTWQVRRLPACCCEGPRGSELTMPPQ